MPPVLADALAALSTLGDLGLPARLAALTAVVLGVALSLADHALAGTGAYSAATTGLVLGLAAAGLYDTARLVSPRTGPAGGTGAGS